MVLVIQTSGMVGTSGPSKSDEQRLSSFADAVIGVSFLIINDLKLFKTDQTPLQPNPQLDTSDEAEEQIPNTSSKGGTGVFSRNQPFIVLGLDNHEQPSLQVSSEARIINRAPKDIDYLGCLCLVKL